MQEPSGKRRLRISLPRGGKGEGAGAEANREGTHEWRERIPGLVSKRRSGMHA
jgi:hypothetical protein